MHDAANRKVFHFPVKDGIMDVDASSYSEARRKFFKATGNFPDPDDTIEVENA